MPSPVYPIALDAAPQDGRWMDDPSAVARVVRFLVSKLSPADLAELDGHLADNTDPQATDHRLPEGKIKEGWLDYTPKNRRAMRDSLFGSRPNPLAMDKAERDAIHAKLFPNKDRLK